MALPPHTHAVDLGPPDIIDRPPPSRDELELVRTIVRVLDELHLDPIIGLFLPGLGDLVSSALGLYTVRIARERGLPPVVIARMLLNLAIDAGLGAIPVAGDVFDFVWRAHKRNLALLESHRPGGKAKLGDWLLVGGAGLLLLTALAAPIAIVVLALRAIF